MSDSENSVDSRLETFIRRMPKAEIHVHLEGSVRPATLLELAQRNGVQPPAGDEAGLREFFRFRDFPHFIEVYIAVCSCLRTPEDFATIVLELGEDAAAQNIRYLEIHFNPETNVRKRGLDFHQMLAGMNRGRAEARERWGVEMRWIADGVRDSETSPYSVTQTVDWITALSADDGVVALGLGGNEVGYPPAPFVADFARARAAGLHTVAHAGETTGHATICDSLDFLGVERIGHGVRAMENPRARGAPRPGPHSSRALPDQQPLHRRRVQLRRPPVPGVRRCRSTGDRQLRRSTPLRHNVDGRVPGAGPALGL